MNIAPSALANGKPQLGFPSCINCSNTQGGFVNAAKNAGKTLAQGAVAVGAWLSNPQDAAADVLQAAFEWSPLGDIWDAVRIKSTGGCSNGVCSDMINPTQFGPSSSFNPAGGGFLLYPNKANTNMMQSVYSK